MSSRLSHFVRDLAAALRARWDGHARNYATTRRGRRLYVDREDLRGAALIEQHGDLYPAALRIWNRLLALRAWTHVVDVGANYGEMIIDMAPDYGARVIAVEPNPSVRKCLEQSLRKAGLAVEIVAKAISDREGTIELLLDRTWSGLSGLKVRPDMADHRLEALHVATTTLRALLQDATPDRDKRVLLKIDVEGHELAILRGLDGAASRFGEFAALVEIRHLADTDLAEIMASFDVALFDERTGTFVTVTGGSRDRLDALLQSGTFYRDDAVLRPRGSPPLENGREGQR